MKRVLLLTAVALLLVSAVLLSSPREYKREAIVLYECGGAVYCKDTTAHYWRFIGEGYAEGEHITLILSSDHMQGYRLIGVEQ